MDGAKVPTEFIIKISPHAGPDLAGEVTVIANYENYAFKTALELVSVVENKLTRDCQHLENRLRSWQPRRLQVTTRVVPVKPKEVKASHMTFHLRVLFTENHSWQGRVQWLENQRSQYFRSCLELIMLLDEARRITASKISMSSGM